MHNFKFYDHDFKAERNTRIGTTCYIATFISHNANAFIEVIIVLY